jgi:zinc/manganese transport system substrate-binding protein
MRKWVFIFLILFAPSTLSTAQPSIKVVVSFSILKDLVENVGGEAVTVTSLVGPNSDAHIFEPTPESAQLISEADLILINGLGFEGWMSRLLESTKTKAKIVVVSQGIKPRTFVQGSASSQTSSLDPHAWHDVKNVGIYINNIEGALLGLMPYASALIQKNASYYCKQLNNLETWIHKELGSIPIHQRTVVTAHDAFGYLSEAYQIKFLAPQGLSTESEPSAQEVVRLIKDIQKHGIGVVFIENITNERLIRHIAEETGVIIGGMLYSDALSEKNQPAATYIDLMKTNIQLLKSGMLKNK